MTAADVTNFKQRQAAGESVVAVNANDNFSEYQLLQGLLLPSGNNLADALARFDAGSVDGFVAKMNQTASKLGMQHTKFADTNGASNQSQSTPGDLVVLEEKAMTQPAFAEIVKQPEANLPSAGRVFNVNAILGQEGIIGVKTGSLPDVGIANFAFAATAQVGSQPITILGAVTGQDSLAKAFDSSKALIKAVRSGVKVERVATSGDPVGYYDAPWGGKATVLTPKDVDMLAWPGLPVKTSVNMPSITAPAASDTTAGTMTVTLGDQQVKLDLKTSGPIPKASTRWRLTRTR
jgi:D-alanyl-D-alanine carboxypeptidase (penicillin-binding protein 5/6)